jgi:hypothetical protein
MFTGLPFYYHAPHSLPALAKQTCDNDFFKEPAMMKRILLIFFVLAASILPAAAATRSHRHKHSASRSQKKSTHRHAKSSGARKAARHRKP